jgi:16S rRNA processing protein RimM
MANRFIEMGSCRKVHGVKGGFLFSLYNTQQSSLKKGVGIYLFPLDKSSCLSPKGEKMTIKDIYFGNNVRAFLEGIENRSVSEQFIPFSIKITRDKLGALEDGEFYFEDLLGLWAFEKTGGKKIGRVSSYYDNDAQMVLVVDGENPIEVPLVETFIPEIDLENKKIYVNLPQII